MTTKHVMTGLEAKSETSFILNVQWMMSNNVAITLLSCHFTYNLDVILYVYIF
jgi:hypothetical protein